MPFALKIQPALTKAQQKQLHDALQLSSLCGKPFVPVTPQPAPTVEQLVGPIVDRPKIFVDAMKGSDSNAGTQQMPFKTIARALSASRSAPHGIADAPVIQLRGGTYYLNDTLVLSTADSGLTIAAYQNEAAVISGGTHLRDLKWSKSTKDPRIWVTPVKEHLGGSSGGFISSNGALPAGNDIRKANVTIASAEVWCQGNATCAGFTVHLAGGAGSIKSVYFKNQAGVGPTIPNSEWETFRKPPVGTGPALPAMPALQFPTGDAAAVQSGVFSRATLARFPNANAELDLFPKGYITSKNTQQWLAPEFRGKVCDPKRQCGESVNLTRPAPRDEWHGMYQDYTVGIGGSCDVYTPPWSPWCSGDFYLERQFPEMHTRHPSGVTTDALPNAPYNKPEGAIVHAWRPGHWYSWMFQVESCNLSHSVDPGIDDAHTGVGASYRFATDKGGNQGGEGSDTAGEWWIEGMEEDLDAPNEFWYDEAAKNLYFYYNGTGTPPNEASVPSLANLIELQGAQAYPIRNVSLLGLTFTANRPTFMEPRGNPSGGDWGLERMGAVMLEGVEDTLISGCTFTMLDSNALFLSGYSRRAVIANNSFAWLGQNAIASWGKPLYNDGTNGDQPRGTVVRGNYATEVGIIQKQSSMYFQAETAQATIVDNIAYNIPRAAV